MIFVIFDDQTDKHFKCRHTNITHKLHPLLHLELLYSVFHKDIKDKNNKEMD